MYHSLYYLVAEERPQSTTKTAIAKPPTTSRAGVDAG